jgi:hypothetical protein
MTDEDLDKLYQLFYAKQFELVLQLAKGLGVSKSDLILSLWDKYKQVFNDNHRVYVEKMGVLRFRKFENGVEAFDFLENELYNFSDYDSLPELIPHFIKFIENGGYRKNS